MYKKIKPAQLFDGYQLFEEKVLVLTERGTIVDIVDPADAGEDVEVLEGILSPGFINSHCHLELSHMKGIIEEHTGLLRFVNQIVSKRYADPEAIPAAIERAEAEMIRNGIVAVGDICNTTDTLFQKEKGHLYYHNFVEVIGFEPAQAQQHFDTYKVVYDAYCERFHPRQVSLTPHAPYSVSTPLLKLLATFPGNQLLSIHNQETEDENEWFLNSTGGFKALYERLQLKEVPVAPEGKSSIQTYSPYLPEGQQLLFIHNVFTTAADIRYALDRFPDACWCLCPNANYYITNRLPDIPMFQKEGVPLVLGTDSLASNYSLSIWEEILRIQKHYPQIPLEQMLSWATINGARALQIGERYGSFEKGKKPGVIQILNDTINRLY
ncbi:amidohydrolase family protein [Niabella sp. CC-SYL272]|uniref:amidohydrolase family protein n=1 Tax=Niabella agricola TaxID=2891571 RepID=UPI001F3CC098|nr:amidohydrolase family protein [Niabella agricola]MCF3110075.1 amidohydrolase family protein [Niabella agricola]